MSLDAPSVATCKLLDAQTVSGVVLAWGTNLFRGPIRAVGGNIPAQSVFALTMGGQTPRQYHEAKSTIIARVLVYVRANVNAFEAGEDLARAVLTKLHRNVPAGYIDCLADVAEPEYAGDQNTEQPHWIIPLSLTREE